MAEWLGALGGFAGAIGGFLNNNNSIDAQMEMLRMQQQFNAEQAKINRDWTESMRKTSYQTAMEDMKKGGLNPILAGSLGGAPTPGVAPASMGSGSVPTQQNWLAQGVSSGVDLVRAITQAELTQAEVKKTEATTDLVKEQTASPAVERANLLAQIERAKGDTRTEEERRQLVKLEQMLLGAQAQSASAAAGASGAQQYHSTMLGDKTASELRYLDQHGAFPGAAQGYSGPGFRTPPLSQIDRDTDAVLRSLRDGNAREGAHSGRSLDDALGGRSRTSVALDSLTEMAGRAIRALGQRFNENQGRNPFQGPNPIPRPRRSTPPSDSYFPPNGLRITHNENHLS